MTSCIQVLLDGIDIQKLDVSWLRSITSLVNQEPVIFNGTVLENIKYGNDFASMEQVIEAARLSNSLEFIEKLPEQLDTKVWVNLPRFN